MKSILLISENKDYIKNYLRIFKICNIGNKIIPYKNTKRYLKNIIKDAFKLLSIMIDNNLLSFETMITNIIYQSKDINSLTIFYDYFNSASYISNGTQYFYPSNTLLLINSITINKNNFLILSSEYYYYMQLLLNHKRIKLCQILMYAIFLVSILVHFNIEEEEIDRMYDIFFGTINRKTIKDNLLYYNYKSLQKLSILECINILNGVTLNYKNYQELVKYEKIIP
jgi:hypothetical protein